jgi:hypothetical protein
MDQGKGENIIAYPGNHKKIQLPFGILKSDTRITNQIDFQRKKLKTCL